MKAVTKLMFFNEQGEKFFGEGPCRLLNRIETTGSLRAAANSMGMAYTKALKMLKAAEDSLGYPLTTRKIGGENGGGSMLTPEGAAWVAQYEAYRDACTEASRRLFRKFYPQVGCVILASGLGKRFGGNKLMADFDGEPMVSRIMDATQGLFARRVVVTRYQDVALLGQQMGMEVILHDLPYRSDSVRLGLERLIDMDGCMFCPGDQPLLRRETVVRLLRGWSSDQESIWRTAFASEPGAPVLFPSWIFPELMSLPEGEGGGWVLKQYAGRIRTVSANDRYELMDVDTPNELAALLELTTGRADTGKTACDKKNENSERSK